MTALPDFARSRRSRRSSRRERCRRSISSAVSRRIDAGRELNAFITVMRRAGPGGGARAERRLAPDATSVLCTAFRSSVKDLVDVAGIPTTAGSALPPRIPAGRAGRHAAARRRRDRHRQDQPSRVRVRHDQRGVGVRVRAASARSVASRRAARAAASAAALALEACASDRSAPTRAARSGSRRPRAARSGSSRRSNELSCEGVVALSRTLDHVGPMARTVADAACCFRR